MYQPPTITFTISFPGTLLEPSFLDLSVSAASATATSYTGSVYDAWCLDRSIGINVVGSYTANIYSSYELGTFSDQASLQFHGNAANLDNVNWLLNFYTGPASGYTYSEVQGAIWSLMGSNPIATFMGAQDPAKITELVNLALANDGFVPDAGQAFGVILDPINAAGVHQQPLIIETKAAKLGDFVWNDLNANGVQDAGEPGIAGVTVQLVRDMNGDGLFTGPNEVIATGITDANGGYAFMGLTPGLNYQVVVSQPAGFDAASPRQVDSNPGSGSNSDGPVSDVVVLNAGQYNTTIDAGFYKYASLGDRVWVDLNSNGVQDAGEAGLSGVTVVLLDAAGNTKGSQVTDVNGNYLFTNLVPGAYLVQFVAPGGYTLTTKDANGNTTDAIDSDANPITGKTDSITLASGESNLTVDAGLVPVVVPKAHIGDFVFEDKNADGVQGASEPGIAGVTVNLKDTAGNVVATTVTNGVGGYGFDVAPGTYSVQVVAPGFSVSPQGQGGNPALDSNIDSTGKTAPVTVASGETNNTIDAGLFHTATLGDRVWLDTNANGIQDAGEAGIAGVTVNLCNAAGAIVATQTTDGSGNYLFTNLNPGTYSVQFVAPAGYFVTSKDANANASDAIDSDADQVTGKTGNYLLASGDDNRTVDAGLYQKAHIGDFVFEDKNASGVQDAGEPGIAGVTVNLKDGAGNVVATTTTGANGSYGFDVVPGTYSVQVVAPGYTPAPQGQGGNPALDSNIDTTGNTAPVTLGSGQTDNSIDAGLFHKASLGDKVWLDSNGNGLQDAGEPGLSGVTVNLCNAANQIVATTTTDAAGNYLFSNLTPGSYSVLFVAPAGYTLTTQDANANASDTLDSDANVATGKTGSYVLASGDTNLTVDAGLVPVVVPKAHIGDFVFEDKNADGVQGASEPGIAGVTVNLLNTAGAVVGTTVTGANGGYGFDVAPGTYSVQVVAPGYAASPQTQGTNAAIDSNINASGVTAPVTLAAGETNNTIDAGLYHKASLGDRVWLDSNGNGIQDAGEAGIAGVTVSLCNAAGAVVATQTTDAAGNYLFTNLTPGSYSVLFAAPAGYFLTAKDANANASDSLDSDADQVTGKTGSYVLASGDQNLTVDAGVYQKAHLGDFVFQDTNANGIQDAGEPGIAGVTVNLKNAAGVVVGTTVTAANGSYGFDVAPGTYSVQVVAPGYSVAPQTQGTNTAIDSNIDATGNSAPVTLSSGQSNNTIDAGLYKMASLGDRVWLDTNGNGQQDAGELGKAGVVVNLLNAAGAVIATQTTDANGNYLFTNLTPGSYSVQFTAPTGYDLTTANVGAAASDSDANATTGITSQYTLGSGETNLTVDAGLVASKVNLGDRVWFDCNKNGVQDAGETGVAGVKVYLIGAGNDGVFGTADDTSRSTTTNAQGNYLFDQVGFGTYKVRIDVPANTLVTTANAGSNVLIDSDVVTTVIKGTTNLIVNGSFENGSTGWTGDGDTIEVGLATSYGSTGATGTHVVELDANKCGAAGFYQNVQTSAGQVYELAVDLGLRAGTAASTNTVEVWWAGAKIATIDPTSTALTTYTFSVKGTGGADRLEFHEQTGDDDGLGGMIDNVRLVTYNTVTETAPIIVNTSTDNLTVDAGLTVAYKLGIDVQKYVSTTTSSTPTECGGEGASVGWWKGHCSYQSDLGSNGWAGTGCKSTDSFDSVFGVKCTGGTKSIYEVLCTTGTTSQETAMRECVAAYLNACSKDVNYSYSKDQVCTRVQHAFDASDYNNTCNTFSSENNLGCNFHQGASSDFWKAGCSYQSSLGTTGWSGVGCKATDSFNAIFGTDCAAGTKSIYQVLCSTSTAAQDVLLKECATAYLNSCHGSVSYAYSTAEVCAKARDALASTDYDTASKQLSQQNNMGCKFHEGATATYWKGACAYQSDLGSNGWAGTGCKSTDSFNSVFGVTCAKGTKSVYEVLCSTSKAAQDVMMKECVAAYLNASHTYVDYAYSKEEVRSLTKAALSNGDSDSTSSVLSRENNLGCDWTTVKSSYTNTVNSTLYDANAAPGLDVVVGSTVTFTYIVKNTGDTALKNISLTDDRISSVVYVSGDTNNNGLLDTTETWTYKATEVAQAGTIKNIGTVVGTDAVGGLCKVTATDPAYYTGTAAAKSSLGDRVWFDSNANGLQDSGEAGAAGVKISLKGAGVDGLFGTADDIAATTTTNANGNYEFTNLNPGKYQVTVAGVTGYTFTTTHAGTNDAVDSDVDANGVSPVITLGSNEHNLTVDAGLKAPTQTASLGDRVWQDTNFNGLQDAGEAGIGGVTVKLLNSVGAVVATTTTNDNGNYLFSGLAAGDYKVQVTTPTGYYVTKQSVGSDGAINSDINSAGLSNTVHLNSGDNNLSLDAGLYRKASVGDKVWQDANHNNLQDEGEAGIGGVTVKLMDATGTTVLATTTTNSSGNYQFSNLDPSSYVLQFDKTNVIYLNTNMNAWKWAVKDVGSNDAIDSDVAGNAIATTNVSQTSAFTLVSGQADMTRDAGITPLVIDLDHNGIHTTSLANSTGSFDLFNNGTAVKSGWISSGDGFLVVDSNGNGKIDNISEMFGGTQAGQGFAKLATYDSNHDGVVDARDAHFADLRVWQDTNGNHVTDAGELMTLAQAGVESLTVTYNMLPALDESGNLHGERSSATLTGGQSVDMTDLYFNVSAADAKAAGVSLPSFGDLLGDDRSLGHLLGGSALASTGAVHHAETNEAMHAGDAGEAMRRLAALNHSEGHAMAA